MITKTAPHDVLGSSAVIPVHLMTCIVLECQHGLQLSHDTHLSNVNSLLVEQDIPEPIAGHDEQRVLWQHLHSADLWRALHKSALRWKSCQACSARRQPLQQAWLHPVMPGLDLIQQTGVLILHARYFGVKADENTQYSMAGLVLQSCAGSAAHCKDGRTAAEATEAHMLGSLKSRSPRERETARPVLVPRAVVMMRQQRCISTRPPQRSTRARSRSSPGLWSARTRRNALVLACPHSSLHWCRPVWSLHTWCQPRVQPGKLCKHAGVAAGACLLSEVQPSSPVTALLCNPQHAPSKDTCLRCTVLCE